MIVCLLLFIVWPLFVIYIFIKIPIIFTYWNSYIHARISYKKDPYTAENNLIKIKQELDKMDLEEFKCLLNHYFHNNVHKTHYDPELHEKLIFKKRGYEKGIKASMRCKKIR